MQGTSRVELHVFVVSICALPKAYNNYDCNCCQMDGGRSREKPQQSSGVCSATNQNPRQSCLYGEKSPRWIEIDASRAQIRVKLMDGQPWPLGQVSKLV